MGFPQSPDSFCGKQEMRGKLIGVNVGYILPTSLHASVGTQVRYWG